MLVDSHGFGNRFNPTCLQLSQLKRPINIVLNHKAIGAWKPGLLTELLKLAQAQSKKPMEGGGTLLFLYHFGNTNFSTRKPLGITSMCKAQV